MNSYFAKRIRIPIIICFLFLTIGGCEKIEIGEPFNCKVGTEYNVDNNLSFIIESVRDYRCPKNILCFWGGDVELNFIIHNNSIKTDTLIYLYKNNPVKIQEYLLKINEVNPWLNLGQQAKQNEYRINILITKI